MSKLYGPWDWYYGETKYYCQRSRVNERRYAKKQAHRWQRQRGKEQAREEAA